MKRFSILALLFLTATAWAQFTTVSGTVTDPNGLPYANGTITATLISSASPTLNGFAYTPPTQPVGLSTAGSFTMRLGDNTVLLPGGTTWNFLVCSALGTVQPAGGKGPVCFSVTGLTISGASQSITATLTAAVLPLSTVTGGGLGPGIVFGAPSTTTNPIGAQPPVVDIQAIGNQPLEIHSPFAQGIDIYTHNNGTSFRSPIINFLTSSGTQTAPTALGHIGFETNLCGQMNFAGYDGTSYDAIHSPFIGCFTDEVFSAGHRGASIHVYGTNIGGSTQEKFQFGGLDQNGFNTNASNIAYSGLCLGGAGGSQPCLFNTTGGLLVGRGTFAPTDTSAFVEAAAFISGGTKFTTNAGCTESTLVGGAEAGNFKVGQNTACTVIVTIGGGITSPNGWACQANDETAVPAVAIRQTAHTTTTASLLMTVATNDVISFSCTGY